MTKIVYRTQEGQKIVESFYRKILEQYTTKPYNQFFIKTEYGDTHILQFGTKEKPPLILIHGTASNSASWLGNIADFIDHFCIYCIDIPGEPGLSEPVRLSLASEAPYNWLNTVLKALNITKASFVTISLGSWYVLNFAIVSPEKVKKISLITTPGIVDAKKSFIIKVFLFMFLGKQGKKLINKTVFHKTEVPDIVLEFQEIVTKHFIPLLERIPIFKDYELKKIEAPLQFFGGDHDALIDSVKTANRIKDLVPNADVHILKDTGHVIINQFQNIKNFLLSD